jgi:UDP-N-acetylglucosamine 3-dehydrogenase
MSSASGGSAAPPLDVTFLGCGFITRVHSRHLRALGNLWRPSYASRDGAGAVELRGRFSGRRAYVGYADALADPDVDAVVVAVPPRWHLELTLAALEAGKHVLVEKPAFLRESDYLEVIRARDAAGKTVIVGENDHYKPLAVTLRRLLADEVVGDMLMASFTSVADKPKGATDWRNDPDLAGGDAFFEEGVHWLHLAGSLGPRIVRVDAHTPTPAREPQGEDRRGRSALVAFDYDNGAVGAIFYSREVPSLLGGLRLSKIYGRRGVITFESNGGAVVVHTRGLPRVVHPGWRDIRGYRAMYSDFAAAIHASRPPQMSVERALEDHRLMEQVTSA